MNAKTKCLLVMMIAFSVTLMGFAADVAPRKITLDGILHNLWIGKGASESIVVIDVVDAPGKGINSLTLASTFTREAILKSFLITLSESDSFVPSGEIAFLCPSKSPLRLYGKVNAKPLAGAKGTEYSLNYFAGLNELREYCAFGHNGANITLFSSKGEQRVIALPGALFTAMPAKN